jgi:hypothetical protein
MLNQKNYGDHKMQVPLLDLKAQYKSLKKELDEAVIKVAESQYFILGPEVEGMENDFNKYLNVNIPWVFPPVQMPSFLHLCV